MQIDRNTKVQDLPELLSVGQFSSFTGVGKTAIYDLLRLGKIPCIRIGRQFRIVTKKAFAEAA